MPQHDDAPEPAGCHGCARVIELNQDGYCEDCAQRRADDPVVTIHGRSLHYSELKMQAEAGDKDLAAAIEGDTVQEQIAAARGVA